MRRGVWDEDGDALVVCRVTLCGASGFVDSWVWGSPGSWGSWAHPADLHGCSRTQRGTMVKQLNTLEAK